MNLSSHWSVFSGFSLALAVMLSGFLLSQVRFHLGYFWRRGDSTTGAQGSQTKPPPELSTGSCPALSLRRPRTFLSLFHNNFRPQETRSHARICSCFLDGAELRWDLKVTKKMVPQTQCCQDVSNSVIYKDQGKKLSRAPFVCYLIFCLPSSSHGNFGFSHSLHPMYIVHTFTCLVAQRYGSKGIISNYKWRKFMFSALPSMLGSDFFS